MKIKNLTELNGVKNGAFTIVIDEEKNGLAITGNFSKGATIVYFKELDKVSEIIKDIKVFGFEIELELEEEKRIFKILMYGRSIIATSDEIQNPFGLYVLRKCLNIKLTDDLSCDDIIDLCKDKKHVRIIEVEI